MNGVGIEFTDVARKIMSGDVDLSAPGWELVVGRINDRCGHVSQWEVHSGVVSVSFEIKSNVVG